MSSYDFQNIRVSILDAIDNYLKTNDAPLYVNCGLTEPTLTVNTSAALTADQLTTLTNLVNTYIEPPYYLTFARTESTTLHSHYTNDPDLIEATNGNKIVQTMIFSNRNTPNGEVLDCSKTILEFCSPNVHDFINTTTGSVQFEIYDITRNFQISQQTIDIFNIATQWNTLAQTGLTTSNTVFQTTVCPGLLNKSTNYDCIWQFRLSTSNPTFTCRMNGLQYIFSNQQLSTLT